MSGRSGNEGRASTLFKPLGVLDELQELLVGRLIKELDSRFRLVEEQLAKAGVERQQLAAELAALTARTAAFERSIEGRLAGLDQALRAEAAEPTRLELKIGAAREQRLEEVLSVVEARVAEGSQAVGARCDQLNERFDGLSAQTAAQVDALTQEQRSTRLALSRDVEAARERLVELATSLFEVGLRLAVPDISQGTEADLTGATDAGH